MKKTYEPTDEELIRWVAAWGPEDDLYGAGYHFGVRTPVPGEVVVIHSHGKYRRGIVVSVGRLNAKVALTTPSAVEGARQGYELTRVNGKSMPFSMVAGASGSAEMADESSQDEYQEPEVPTGPCAAPGCDEDQQTHLHNADGSKFPRPTGAEDDTCDGTDHDCENHPAPAASEPETAEPAPVAQATGSEVVATLEKTWETIRANHPELPSVVIVTGSGMVGKPRWGHFLPDSWTEREGAQVRHGEMFVAGETLARGAQYTVETMLHEAAHVLARVRKIQDTSRQGRWHNQKFRHLAEELGLEYPKEAAHPQAGFSECLMTPGTREEYAPVIDDLDRAIRLHVSIPVSISEGQGGGPENIHGAKKTRKEGGSTTNNLKAVCGCENPRIIRVSRKVLEEAPIMCGICRQPFEPEESKFEPTDEDG